MTFTPMMLAVARTWRRTLCSTTRNKMNIDHLHNGAECELGGGGEAGQRAAVFAEDPLAAADARHRLRPPLPLPVPHLCARSVQRHISFAKHPRCDARKYASSGAASSHGQAGKQADRLPPSNLESCGCKVLANADASSMFGQTGVHSPAACRQAPLASGRWLCARRRRSLAPPAGCQWAPKTRPPGSAS